jgi:hypothetical protein
MTQNTQQFPAEEVTLPSKGLLYPKDSPLSKGVIEMKYMTALLIAARILGYGKDFTFEHKGEEITIDLTTIEDKELDPKLIKEGKNEFNFTLPVSKTEVTFKLLTHKDDSKIEQELKGLRKINKEAYREISTRMKHLITSVNGDYETKTIREFVDNSLLAIDARELRNYVKEIQPSVDLSFNHEDNSGNIKEINIPVNVNFFWPDAEV